jgi:MFS family permease
VRLARDLLGIIDFPGARRWAAASLLDAVGSGLLAPLTVLYFTIRVGLSAASVGLGLTIGGVAALACAPLGGILIDRFGAKRVLIGYWALAACAYAGYGLVTTWPQFVVAVTVAEVASTASGTASKSLLAELAVGADRVTLLASRRSLRNLGYGIGSLLATAALAIGGAAYLIVVYGDAMSFLVAIALTTGVRPPRRPSEPSERGPATRGLRRVLRDRPYLRLTALDFLSSFHQTGLEVALPLWIVLHTQAPRALAGILFTFNTVIVVLVQVRATAGVRGLADVPRTYRRAATSMLLCAGAYLAAHYVGTGPAIALLVVGLVLHTITEMLASAGEWIASMELADDAHRGSYLSVFSLGSALQGALGPTLVTSVLALGGVWLWPALAAAVGVGSLLAASLTGRLHLRTLERM